MYLLERVRERDFIIFIDLFIVWFIFNVNFINLIVLIFNKWFILILVFNFKGEWFFFLFFLML